MSKRNLILLLVAAAVLIGLAAVSLQPRSGGLAGVGEPLLPALETRLNGAAVIELRSAAGRAVTLRQRDGVWRVDERGGYPASVGQIRQLLLDLRGITTLEAKTADPAKYHYLGLQDPDQPEAKGTLLRVLDAGGEPIAGLMIGNSNAEGHFVRRLDQPQSWLVKGVPVLDPDPGIWLDRDLLDVAAASIHRVELRPVDAAGLVLERPAPDAAFALIEPAAPLADSAAAEDLSRALVGLRLDDARPAAEMSLENPSRAVFRTFEGWEIVQESVRDGDASHSRWSVSFDPALAARFLEAAGVTGEARERALAERRARAEALDARLAGWVFTLPRYLAKRFEVDPARLSGPGEGG